MTHKNFYLLIGEAMTSPDLEAYITEWRDSSIFEPGTDTGSIVADLKNIWTVAHMTIKEMASCANLNQSSLARRFNIPLRTVQDWAAGVSGCPIYTRLMMADLLGLITVSRS